MTKDEIKALISAKVAGQGDQVDAGGALSEILNALCDAVDSAPKAVVVKETLSSTPIEISKERYNELTEGPILKYDGKDYLIYNDLALIGGNISTRGGISGAMYTHKLTVDDTGAMDTYDQILLYIDGNAVGHIALLLQ